MTVLASDVARDIVTFPSVPSGAVCSFTAFFLNSSSKAVEVVAPVQCIVNEFTPGDCFNGFHCHENHSVVNLTYDNKLFTHFLTLAFSDQLLIGSLTILLPLLPVNVQPQTGWKP